jgi:hypothetical protein
MTILKMRFIGVMNVSSDINMKNIAPTLKGDTIILRKPKESDIDDRMEIGRSKVFVRMCGGDTRGDFRSFTHHISGRPANQFLPEMWLRRCSRRSILRQMR